ncbi:DUF4365 domain-containing protein [Longispora urticae]
MTIVAGAPTPHRGDLDEKQCMETLQNAYLHAVAAAARCAIAKPSHDRGIDWIVTHQSGHHTADWEAVLRIQLKSTYQTAPDVSLQEVPITIRNDRLRRLTASPVTNSSILVAMLIPRSIDEWVHVQMDSLTMRHSCYWVNLEGFAITGKEKTVVKVPTAQVFDEHALCEMMDRIGKGGKA